MPWPREVKHVALCGWPKCGKSTIAEMLVDEFGGAVIDDGLVLRQALPILTGIDPADPFSQEGKSRVYQIGNRQEEVRKGLGELGNWLEDRYGEEILALRAMEMAPAIARAQNATANFFVYPSVRKSQGLAYKRAGGIVIQIDNPLAVPSENAFDRWDASCVDLTITNDPGSMGLDELRDYVARLPELLDALIHT